MLQLKKIIHEEINRCRVQIELGNKELALNELDSIDDRIDTMFQDDINALAKHVAYAKAELSNIEARIFQSEFLEVN